MFEMSSAPAGHVGKVSGGGDKTGDITHHSVREVIILRRSSCPRAAGPINQPLGPHSLLYVGRNLVGVVAHTACKFQAAKARRPHPRPFFFTSSSSVLRFQIHTCIYINENNKGCIFAWRGMLHLRWCLLSCSFLPSLYFIVDDGYRLLLCMCPYVSASFQDQPQV